MPRNRQVVTSIACKYLIFIVNLLNHIYQEESMPAVLVAGSGQIGSAISHLLSQSHTGYKVLLADIAAQPPKQILLHDLLGYVSLDLQSQPLMIEVIRQYQIEAVVSCLPYFLNPAIAELAKS